MQNIGLLDKYHAVVYLNAKLSNLVRMVR